jgi:hypothetical protein
MNTLSDFYLLDELCINQRDLPTGYFVCHIESDTG